MKFQPSKYSYGAAYGESEGAFWDYNITYQLGKKTGLWGQETEQAASSGTAPSGSPSRPGGSYQPAPHVPAPGTDPYKVPLTQQTWFWPAAIAGSFAVLGAVIYFAPEGTDLPIIGKR